MSRLKRWTEILILVVGLPLVGLLVAGIMIAVGESVFVYAGSLLAAWMFSAFALPMLFGALSPREIVENYQWRRRNERFFEGERLGGDRARRPFWKGRFDRYWSPRRREKFYPLEPHRGPRQGFAFWTGRFTPD